MMEKVSYPLTLSLKIDGDTFDELADIALFERTKKSTFARGLLVDAVQRYRRNPQYLKFKRQLDANKGKK